MPDAPAAIFTPASEGGAPAAPAEVFTPAGAGGAPSAPGAVFAPASAGGAPDAPGAVFAPAGVGGEAAATLANNTIRFTTTSNMTFSGGFAPSTGFTNEDYIYIGGNEWQVSATERIYHDAGYWYLTQYSSINGMMAILRAAGEIGDDPSSLTYAHAPGSEASGGTWTLTPISGDFAGTGVSAPGAIFAPASAGGAPSAPGAVFAPASAGGAPSAPGAVFAPASAGGAPTAPGAVFAPASAGGAPTAPAVVFDPAGTPVDGGGAGSVFTAGLDGGSA